MTSATVALPQREPLTYDDVQRLPDDGNRYELLDGYLLVTPSPIPGHQRCVARLLFTLMEAAPAGIDVLPAPTDWYVDERNVFEPDIVVSRRTDVGERRIEVAPLLVVEIHSPGTRVRDLTLKRAAYERGGADAYWLVDLDGPRLTVLERGPDGRFAEVAAVEASDPFHAERPFPVTVVPADLLA
jgi:Uma2 family endonuclease